MTEKMFPRDQIWAATAAAQRMNSEYVKRGVSSKLIREGNKNYPIQEATPLDMKLTNAALMRIFLTSDQSDILPEDFVKGETIRVHFASNVTLLFEGTIQSFLKQALDASTQEEFDLKDKAIPLIASLPASYARDVKRREERDDLSELSMNSRLLSGNLYDTVELEVTIVDCIFKSKFGSHAVNALVNGTNQLLFFFEREMFKMGDVVKISGRIKAFHGNTTQLNYVRNLSKKEKDTNF